VILSVNLKLKPGNNGEIEAKMKDFVRRRNEKQPVSLPSAGSFFKRPKGEFAGKLIEEAGLKGFAVGGAQVSELHAGFIVNKGNATASDIITLMKEVQYRVNELSGYKLEPEPRILGWEVK
jgi:UDP-N-acetylmuramate dehydrogenase